MRHGYSSKYSIILLGALLATLFCRIPALAETSEDLQTLDMFYEGKDLVVSATRSPKPISQTAENITVVTAADIEMMGAHTLADVLGNVSGLQTDDRGGIGTFSGFSIQGADMFNILVLQDGITLNGSGDGSTDIASIPVEHIERIEIVKGPGSSSWGSALGGVINIVTKSPAADKKLGGALLFSAGERGTRESRGEATGTVGSLGYYLYAGNLTSNGFRPVTGTDANNVYTKFRWELPEKGDLLFTLGYTRNSAGQSGDAVGFAIDDHHSNLLSTLSLSYPIGTQLGLDLSLRGTSKSFDETMNTLGSGGLFLIKSSKDANYGGSAKISLREGIQNLSLGADFDHITFDFHSSLPLYQVVTDQHFKTERWGIFLNDTLTLGDVAVTPGIRFDQMHPVGDFVSPSLGVAWSLNDKTVLRAYGARGYSLPLIVPDSTQEKVVTIQAGAETTQIPYLWFKTTLFLNYISDHLSYDADGNPIMVKLKKQGAEVEARTSPLFNSSLSVGYTFVDATNRDTGEVARDIPRQVAKVGLHYDDRGSFRGALLGRYVWYNASAGGLTKDKAVIWDLNLLKKVVEFHGTALELFFNAHNLFNGAQYNDPNGFENARRWLEGGIRFKF